LELRRKTEELFIKTSNLPAINFTDNVIDHKSQAFAKWTRKIQKQQRTTGVYFYSARVFKSTKSDFT